MPQFFEGIVQGCFDGCPVRAVGQVLLPGIVYRRLCNLSSFDRNGLGVTSFPSVAVIDRADFLARYPDDGYQVTTFAARLFPCAHPASNSAHRAAKPTDGANSSMNGANMSTRAHHSGHKLATGLFLLVARDCRCRECSARTTATTRLINSRRRFRV